MSVLEPLLQKQEALAARLRELSSVLVAYSGGIDSAYLAWAARQALGDAMLAVIADSPSLSRSHLRDALLFAEECGIPVRTVNTAELEHEAYAVNQADRCFHCKDELFTVLEAERARLGFAAVAYGLNTDDKRDFRPGQKAAAAHRVAAPLADAGLTKEDIRAPGAGGRAARLGQAGLRLPFLAHRVRPPRHPRGAAPGRGRRGSALRAGAPAGPRAPSWNHRPR